MYNNKKTNKTYEKLQRFLGARNTAAKLGTSCHQDGAKILYFNNTNCVKATAEYQNRKIVYH